MIFRDPGLLQTIQKSTKNWCQEPSKLKHFFETLPKRPRSPPGALLEGIFGKKVKFWCPSWDQVGPMLGPKGDKKGAKKGTYVKTPLGLHFGTVLGSILVSFWARFWCRFGIFLTCFLFLSPLSLLCFACWEWLWSCAFLHEIKANSLALYRKF